VERHKQQGAALVRQPGRTGDGKADRAIDDLRTDIGALRSPFLRGSLTKSIPIEAGENTIAHGLSQKPLGWWVTRAIGGAPRLQEVSSDADRLVLRSDTAATVDLWVF
jgi:hypothetical protein